MIGRIVEVADDRRHLSMHRGFMVVQDSEGERKELKICCDCRKPGIGMIQKAVADLNIDLGQSWFIGDTTTDVQTAKNAGLRSILVRTGAAGKDCKHSASADFFRDDLPAAVKLILERGTKSTDKR